MQANAEGGEAVAFLRAFEQEQIEDSFRASILPVVYRPETPGALKAEHAATDSRDREAPACFAFATEG